MKKIILSACFVSAITFPAFAGTNDFTNGGFENGTLSGWTLNSGVWNSSGAETLNNSYQGDSAVITDASAKDANTNGNLFEVLQGSNSLRLNNAANGYHFSRLTQTVTDYTGADLYFGFAAVLENPANPHTEAQTPKFDFTLMNVTTGETLYRVQFDSRNASSQGITWNAGKTTSNGPSTWMYSNWNVVHVDTSKLTGNTLGLIVTAYDCGLGGHGGYAYVDSFQPTAPTPNEGVIVNNIDAINLTQVPEPSSFVLAGLGIASLALLRRNSGRK
jgi:hypothetical protein